MTTIVAPAGYGKTSLAVQWYELLKEDRVKLCWVSLDAEHTSQEAFLLALIDALQTLSNEDGADAGNLPATALLSVLGTRLRKIEEPLVIFLDDYHFAQTDATEALMAKILADLSLEHVKLVLVSRSPPRFPLSALRLRGEFKQFGVAELGFSDAEARELFEGKGAHLTEEQVGSFNRRTEGWAVALQMVSLLVAESEESDTILASFDGGGADMGSYLSEQVFEHLPEDIRLFLIETAALPAFNRPLLEAVLETGEDAGLIERLNEYALPVTLLAGPGNWMRFHPVFNEFLKRTAGRRGIDANRALNRAAHWFEAHGDIDRAVHHALLADNANLAARIVETAGGWRRVYATTRGGATLFQALSGHASEIDLVRFPLATLGLSIFHAKAAQLAAANHYLATAERAASGDPILAKDLRVVRILLALYTDHWASTADLSALEDDLQQPDGMELIHRALALNMLSYNFLIRGELDRALHYGHLAIRAFRDGGADFGAMHLYTHIGQAFFLSGDCASALASYDELICEAQANIGPGSDLDAVGQVLKAEVLSMGGEAEAAAGMLEWALPHLERHDTWFDLLAAGFMAEQRVLRMHEDFLAAHAAMDRIRAAARRRGFDRLSRLIDGERAMLLMASGDLDQAIRHAEANGFGIQAIVADRANLLSIHLRGATPAIFWTRAYLALGEVSKAREVFDQFRTRQSQRLHIPRAIELALIDIGILLAEDRADVAAARLSDLVLTMPLDDYRALLHLDHVAGLGELRSLATHPTVANVTRKRLQSLLVAAETMQEPAIADVGSAFTGREHMVLELLSSGLSNKEIGRMLALSDNTIKFHLRNIFAKLNVSTRTAAVTAARQKGMLNR
ncbi:MULTISPECIES: LuxR C-terminal-related transcriptional regulator [unclassified Rhizobium]|uniref:LuxR C-terminal-related transcriptional regulator n=1 Tax=unclassified Rhizobium TaxID=2613769 RepID=UPI0017CB2732|nr:MULTISPECIES: LuxR C-terminal-related transcriptional regulator [unclassified Rhizobium]MBB3285101.1 LuxR family maltose regulon positive regulatory protein [Rhizobium sp. BK252]MBB3399840.1 LuxR family maltose regulon positive regulatory protein [Rhizobium sp. BK289]MBB3412420.1 LuxR family maltose regulon positive regulatory protein [Rhizobium sp. BK284]MBB3480306.1 LuxR family maltose regulon positive regulatory protein [Rhizobium sp. BK347]